tara:strand:+ start:52 stop:789 length:738 start_codon:yes stop_codon:yes gene_type:complete
MGSAKSQKIFDERKSLVFIILSSIFIASMTMLNVLGTSRFVDLSCVFFGVEIPIIVAIGVLPYPITFLCTDFISELYGPEKASRVVWSGLIVNIWLAFVVWIGGILPEFTSSSSSEASNDAFMTIRELSLGAIFASMVAYLLAQHSDVRIFHFFKNLTKGKYLWIRNNASTMISQLIDTVSVILIVHFLTHSIPLPEAKSEAEGLFFLILYAYIFKFIFALLDTPFFYIGVKYLRSYLGVQGDSR